MNLQQAYFNVAVNLPTSTDVKKRLDKAYDIVRCDGEGYSLHKMPMGYIVYKASTSLLEDNSHSYQVTQQSCDCPDFGSTRGNLCKHRLAVMLLIEMSKGE